MHKQLFTFLTFSLCCNVFGQAPANDNCANAEVIVIPNNGYATGTFVSANSNLAGATTESGETFYSTIQSAGQTAKSVWFEFTLPTARKCTLNLKQPGTLISGNDAGFTVYLANSCFPTSQQADDALLASQTLFGWSANPCLKAGTYMVQVSANNAANGPVYIELDLAAPDPAPYDLPVNAYDFGLIDNSNIDGYCRKAVDISWGCYSMDSLAESCAGLGSDYTQSAWFTFTTGSYSDYIRIALNDYAYTTPHGAVFGYRLYEGDVRTNPLSALTVADGCLNDTIGSKCNGYYDWGYDKSAVHDYLCGALQTNTTYSIQLIAEKDAAYGLRLNVEQRGVQATSSTQPLSTAVAASNQLGILPAGQTDIADYFACNSRLSQNACGNTNPASGVYIPAMNETYELAQWFTFELSQSSNVNFDQWTDNSDEPYIRIFNADVNASCSTLDTASNLVYSFANQANIICMPAGKYSMQILGNSDYNNQDWSWCNGNSGSTYSSWCARRNNLGNLMHTRINVTPVHEDNHFSLSTSSAVDSINGLVAIQNEVSYNSTVDTFGCSNTVLPAGNHCDASATKAIYTEFRIGDGNSDGVPDSGSVSFAFNPSWNWWHNWNILYRGDAMNLANAQNAYVYPDSITGLIPVTPCVSNQYCYSMRACVTPGVYTMVTYGNNSVVGQNINASYVLDLHRTTHYSAALAEDMGNILDTMTATGTSLVYSSVDYYTCLDNPDTIGGLPPCESDEYNYAGGYYERRTKLIYRQFYLSQPSFINIWNSGYNNYCHSDRFAVFNGRATDGIGTLTPYNGWTCQTYVSTPIPACGAVPMPAGWYTVVSYGQGPSYANPTAHYLGGGDLGVDNWIAISVTTPTIPPGPIYNRPQTAAIDTLTNQPFLLATGNRGTADYPATDSIYHFYTEYYDCTTDTPFYLHPLNACDSVQRVRATYYVFTVPQESYLHFGGFNSDIIAQVYPGNARTTPSILQTNTPIQPCVNDSWNVQLCRVQTGTYTLVLLVPDNYNGSSITPYVYVDRTGYSRFDHAVNAYDFAAIPPDSAWHNGKVGDVHPTNSNLAPSNDFFYCTSGAHISDPPQAGMCYSSYGNPNIYNSTQTNNPLYDNGYDNLYANDWGDWSHRPRRNLWYTFVLDGGGYCRVSVPNLTPDKGTVAFKVYKSDVNGTLPFNTVLSSGELDSALVQGLTLVARNDNNYCWYGYSNEISFYREPCSAVPERYYIVVDFKQSESASYNSRYGSYDGGSYDPNQQIDVNILWDTISSVPTHYDYYSTANVINGLNQTAPPYTSVPLTTGTYYGATDNFMCATYSAPSDRDNWCSQTPKTIWYKFTVGQSGILKLRYLINGSPYQNTTECSFDLFRETIPNDSVSGLQFAGSMDNNAWYYDYDSLGNYLGQIYQHQQCITQGTYYLQFTGYNPIRVTENVQPVIEIVNQQGDYCSDPVADTLHGVGSVTISATIDCHTIGEGFGEDGGNMACLIPNGANVNDYKSTWFRFDIIGTDTFDVTPVLNNQTNVASNSIRYRLLYGSCAAMNTGSCFVSANTVNTFNCLTEGTYFIQVVTPNVNQYNQQSTGRIDMTISAAQSPPGCNPVQTCFALANFTTNSPCSTDTVFFVNQSTTGDSIRYLWHLGYGGITDTARSPKFVYPAPALSQTYTVTLYTTNVICNKTDSVTKVITVYKKPYLRLINDTTLCDNATVTLNAGTHDGTTYLWQDGSTDSLFTVTSAGTYYVQDSFNNCIVYDTVTINFQPLPYFDLGADIALCANDTFHYDATQGGNATYAWNTGSVSPLLDTVASGTYTLTVTNNGCSYVDSITITNVATAQPLGNDTVICPNGSLTLDAFTPNASWYSWDDGSGADTRTIYSTGLYWVDVYISSCSFRDSIMVSLSLQTDSTFETQTSCNPVDTGTVVLTLQNQYGCDSIHTVTTTLLPSSATSESRTSCNVSDTGIVVLTLQNQYGCDSVHTITTTLLPSSATFETQTSCYPADTGAVSVTLQNQYGCDSIHTITTTLLISDSTFEARTSCDIADAGSVSVTLSNQFGCDSVHTITTTFIPVDSTFENRASCNPSDTGVVMSTLQNQYGCDSIHTITTTLLPSHFTFESRTSCNAADTGVAVLNLQNQFGCDSIHTVTTTLLPSSSTFESRTSCNPADTGIAVLVLQNQYGCDSIHTVTTTLLPSSATFESQTSCNPADTGAVAVTLQNQYGCDSVHTITTTLLPSDSVFENRSSCNPADTGAVVTHFSNQYGCDSAYIIITTLLPSNTTFETQSSCNPADTGAVILNFQNQYGCDSIHTIQTVLLPSHTTFENRASCNPADTGIVILNLQNQYGCDSVHTITTALLPSHATVESQTSCNPADTGVVVLNLQNQYGCDSVHTITTGFLPGFAVINPNDTIVQFGEQVILNSSLTPYGESAIDAYSWSPPVGLSCTDCANPVVIAPQKHNEYRVTITYNGECEAVASATILVEGESKLYIPNAFSPNGDGINDYFEIFGKGIISLNMKIFNRWGEKVYDSDYDIQPRWDGRYKGALQPPMIYLYDIAIKFADGVVKYEKGSLTLIR